jgi:hypothetical protein
VRHISHRRCLAGLPRLRRTNEHRGNGVNRSAWRRAAGWFRWCTGSWRPARSDGSARRSRRQQPGGQRELRGRRSGARRQWRRSRLRSGNVPSGAAPRERMPAVDRMRTGKLRAFTGHGDERPRVRSVSGIFDDAHGQCLRVRAGLPAGDPRYARQRQGRVRLPCRDMGTCLQRDNGGGRRGRRFFLCCEIRPSPRMLGQQHLRQGERAERDLRERVGGAAPTPAPSRPREARSSKEVEEE